MKIETATNRIEVKYKKFAINEKHIEKNYKNK